MGPALSVGRSGVATSFSGVANSAGEPPAAADATARWTRHEQGSDKALTTL
jgi:hypothetical protein